MLRVLDFELTPTSGCYVKGEPCEHPSAAESCRRCARPFELRTAAPVVAVAAHPRSEDIVVGLQVRCRHFCLGNWQRANSLPHLLLPQGGSMQVLTNRPGRVDTDSDVDVR